jgi:nucleotide-binding universal stress UspA family protein
MSGLIVVGIDGSEGARRALRWAAYEARVRDATLRVVHAWSYLDQPDGFDPKYCEADAKRVLDTALAEIESELDGLEVEPLTVLALPARGLLAAADDADLLVVGARGLGGFRGLLLGSVSQQLVHHASMPLVIVPGDRAA